MPAARVERILFIAIAPALTLPKVRALTAGRYYSLPGVSVVFGSVEGVHVEAALGNRSVGVRKVFAVAYVELEVTLWMREGRERGGLLLESIVSQEGVVR